jgi:plastocyanin
MSENRQRTVRGLGGRPVMLLVAACALGTGVLAGCGSSSAGGQAAASSTSSMAMPSSSADSGSAGSSSSAAGSMAATATKIMIQDFKYATPASVSPGATVSVMNMDAEAHTVTSDKGGTFAVPVPPGKTVTFTAPATAGSFDFHCDYHSTMHGTLVVK